MTREEISKIPVGELIGKKAVYRGAYTDKIRKRVIVKIEKNRLTVKDAKNTLENIPWDCVQSIE